MELSMKIDPRATDIRVLDMTNGKIAIPDSLLEILGYPKSGKVHAQLLGGIGFEVIGFMHQCKLCGTPLIFGEHDEPNPYICAECNKEQAVKPPEIQE